MADNFFKVKKGLTLKPEATPVLTEQGDIAYNSTDDKLKVRGASTTDSVLQEAKSQTLTNKTLDADLNTVSNIDDSNIKSGAAISRDKLAAGTINQVLINDIDGDLSSEAQLAPSRGGTGVSNTATLTYGADNVSLTTAGATSLTLPTTGTLATLAGAEALSNKTQVDVDNLRLDGNTLSSTDTNGDVTLNPNGTGEINLEATVRTNDIDTPGAGTLTVGGTDATVITIGNSGTTVNFNGTVNNNNVTNLNVTDKLITVNDGGGAASGNDSGIEIEENSVITGYMKTSADRNSVVFKAPNTNGITSLTPGASNDVVTLNAATQTLSNKTLSDPLTVAEVATPSTPSSGFGKVYFKSDGFLYQLNDSGTETKVGAGAGGINYITNADFESNADGYSTYKDAAQATPENGTGGSPAVTFVRSVDNSLRGAALGLFDKPTSVSHQGEGFSYQFLIDEADAGKVLSISFDYLTSSAYTSGDLTVYIYDVANSVLIQPAGYTIEKVTGTSNKHIATFQTPTNSINYRLIFHVATAFAGGYTLQVDNVVVGPQIVQYGAPVTSPEEYTPTLTGFTTVTGLYATWARVGKYVQIQGRFLQNGIPTGSTAAVSLPSGLVASSSISDILAVGDWWPSGGSVAYPILIQASDTAFGIGINTNFLTKRPANAVLGPGNSVSFNALIPIQGWEANVVVSNNTDTRVVAALYTTTQTTGIASTGTTILAASNATEQEDTHAAFNTSTGEFTVPVPGIYEVGGCVILSDIGAGQDAAINLRIQKNGTTVLNINNRAERVNSVNGSGLVPCVAGDTLRIQVEQQNAGGALRTITSGIAGANTNPNWVLFKRLSGPSAIAASEKIAAIYTKNVAQAVANNTATIVDFEIKEQDTHGAVTTGVSFKFTAPRADYYRVSAAVGWTGNNTGSRDILLYKNGSAVSYLDFKNNDTASFTSVTNGTRTIYLLAGDYIDIRGTQTSGGSLNVIANAQVNNFCVESTGN